MGKVISLEEYKQRNIPDGIKTKQRVLKKVPIQYLIDIEEMDDDDEASELFGWVCNTYGVSFEDLEVTLNLFNPETDCEKIK